jgi:Zn-finger nucleic acid-binding protein
MFPATQEELFKAGYSYSEWERCPACTLDVEVWLSPGKREIIMEPMPGIKSPATRHYETCQPKENADVRVNTQDTARRDSDSGAGSAPRPHHSEPGEHNALLPGRIRNSGRDAQGAGIKLYE